MIKKYICTTKSKIRKVKNIFAEPEQFPPQQKGRKYFLVKVYI